MDGKRICWDVTLKFPKETGITPLTRRYQEQSEGEALLQFHLLNMLFSGENAPCKVEFRKVELFTEVAKQ